MDNFQFERLIQTLERIDDKLQQLIEYEQEPEEEQSIEQQQSQHEEHPTTKGFKIQPRDLE